MEFGAAPTGLDNARLAATVLLVRDGGDGIEVWAQERVSTMRNYPGVTVFPGGGVDNRDLPDAWESEALWTGPPLKQLSDRLDLRLPTTHALVFAAVRELFEETGTLLAVHEDCADIDDASPYHQDRLDLISHHISLKEMLTRNNLLVRSDLLRPWARWVGGSDKRRWFDTISFIAVAPRGQDPDGDTSEADDAGWFSPRLLLEGWRHGLVRLAIPTWAQLTLLAEAGTVRQAMAVAETADLTPVIGDPINEPRYRDYFTYRPIDRI